VTRRTLPARTILVPPPGAEPSAEAEAQFFRGLRLHNGTYKATGAHRLTDLDALVAAHLPPPGPLRVLDAAASSGVTSLEWLDGLRQRGFTVQMTVADLAIQAWLRRVGPFELLLDGGGRILQVALGGQTTFRPDPMARGLRPRTAASLILLLERLTPADPATDRRSRAVSLVSPRLLAEAGVRVMERDLTQPWEDWSASFEVVRAANFLNLAYFGRETLKRLIRHLARAVVPGGLLAVCRTDSGGDNTASLIRVPATSGDSPVVEGRLGAGSEVEALILDVLRR